LGNGSSILAVQRLLTANGHRSMAGAQPPGDGRGNRSLGKGVGLLDGHCQRDVLGAVSSHRCGEHIAAAMGVGGFNVRGAKIMVGTAVEQQIDQFVPHAQAFDQDRFGALIGQPARRLCRF
jgi:hypothetical protein